MSDILDPRHGATRIPRMGDHPSIEGLQFPRTGVASAKGKKTQLSSPGEGGEKPMTTDTAHPVRVEILARKDCDNRAMAVIVVERVAAEMGIAVELEEIDVTSEAQAKKRRFLGSPAFASTGSTWSRG